MKRFWANLLILLHVGASCAMYSPVPLSQKQKEKYAGLADSWRINELRNLGTQLQTKINGGSEFLDLLKNFANCAEKTSAFLAESRQEKVNDTDVIIARARLYQEGCSLLAGYADFLWQEEVRERISKIADDKLISLLTKIGFFPRNERK